MTERRVEIGVVRSVQAGRRLVRVAPVTGRVSRLDAVEWVWFSSAGDDGGQEEIRCRVESVKEQAGEWALTLAPGVTRDTVASVRGAHVMVEASCMRGGVSDEFGAIDVQGFCVLDENGDTLGVIDGGYSAGGNEVIEIRTGTGRVVRVPLAAPVIVGMDWEERAMTVRDLAPYTVEDSDNHAD